MKRAVHHTHLSHSFCWKVLRTTSPIVMPAKLPQICARYDTGGTVEEYRPYTATPTWNKNVVSIFVMFRWNLKQESYFCSVF